jgi:hypothetical protein
MKAVLVSTGIALMSSVTAAATFAEIRITRVEVSYFAPTDAFVTELDDTEHVFRVTDTSPDALLDVFPGFEYRTFDVAGDSFVSAEVDYSLTVADDGRTIEYIPERCTYVIGYDTCIFPGSTETSFAEVIVGYVHPRGPHQYVSAWPAVVSLETPSAGPDFLTLEQPPRSRGCPFRDIPACRRLRSADSRTAGVMDAARGPGRRRRHARETMETA